MITFCRPSDQRIFSKLVGFASLAILGACGLDPILKGCKLVEDPKQQAEIADRVVAAYEKTLEKKEVVFERDDYTAYTCQRHYRLFFPEKKWREGNGFFHSVEATYQMEKSSKTIKNAGFFEEVAKPDKTCVVVNGVSERNRILRLFEEGIGEPGYGARAEIEWAKKYTTTLYYDCTYSIRMIARTGPNPDGYVILGIGDVYEVNKRTGKFDTWNDR